MSPIAIGEHHAVIGGAAAADVGFTHATFREARRAQVFDSPCDTRREDDVVQSAVSGTLARDVFVSCRAHEMTQAILQVEDASVGEVNLHFPRVGFDVLPAEKRAA